jgi:hypothetical protein
MELTTIQITDAPNEKVWYANRVGEVFPAVINSEGSAIVYGHFFVDFQDYTIVDAEALPQPFANEQEGE